MNKWQRETAVPTSGQEAIVRAINAEPWEPLPGMVKLCAAISSPHLRAARNHVARTAWTSCRAAGTGRHEGGRRPSTRSRAVTRAELIAELAASNPHLRQEDAELIVATIFDQITAALARGERVELRGFGAFTVKQRNARIGRNVAAARQTDMHRIDIDYAE